MLSSSPLYIFHHNNARVVRALSDLPPQGWMRRSDDFGPPSDIPISRVRRLGRGDGIPLPRHPPRKGEEGAATQTPRCRKRVYGAIIAPAPSVVGVGPFSPGRSRGAAGGAVGLRAPPALPPPRRAGQFRRSCREHPVSLGDMRYITNGVLLSHNDMMGIRRVRDIARFGTSRGGT